MTTNQEARSIRRIAVILDLLDSTFRRQNGIKTYAIPEPRGMRITGIAKAIAQDEHTDQNAIKKEVQDLLNELVRKPIIVFTRGTRGTYFIKSDKGVYSTLSAEIRELP